jgi:DNA-binding GntR family transcriptional regulator
MEFKMQDQVLSRKIATKAAVTRSRKRSEVVVESAKPLHLQAYERIKHLIITLRLRPGEYVNEAQVSDILGLGRTPIHQALNRLTLEGMVEVIPRKGIIVKGISLNDVLEITDVRLINEVYCARLAAERAMDSDIRDISRIVDESGKALPLADVERQMMLDRDFHIALSRAANNRVLTNLLTNLHDQSLRFWFISLREREHHLAVHKEHLAILKAIEAHNADAAERAIRTHIDSFRKNVIRLL